MSIKPGQHLGQYVIVEQIGKGGMATVFRASQPSLSRQVAIKILPEFFKEDPTFHDRFRQEAMAIAKLRHPNVLTVFDSGEADGIAYIVTELVEGGTLASKLGKPLPMDDVLAIGGPVASALDYAHARGMIHRDVKPSNILLGHDGTPILADFGLARLTDSGGDDAGSTMTRLTITGSTLGTPEYMAPEQVRNSAVGPSADIYALAVTFYEMLTGAVPYKADTPINVIMSRLNDPLPLPRTRNPNLSEAVQNVLLKGLAMNPEERYRTAGEMVRALETAARTAVTMSPTPPAIVARFPDASTAPTATAIRVPATPAPTPATIAPTPMHIPTPAVAAPRKRLTTLFAAIAAIVIGAAAFLIWQQMWKRPAATNDTSVNTPAPAPPPSPAPPPAAPSTATPTSSVPTPTMAPAAAPTAPAKRPTTPDGLPAHGKLLYSLATNLSELPSVPQRDPTDTIALKNGGIDLTAATESGTFIPIPVNGAGDFVAVLRVASTGLRPTVVFRFHSTPQFEGHIIRFPAYLHLEPPLADRKGGPHRCCDPFDVLIGPQKSDSQSLIQSALPLSTPATANEEQTYAVAVTGPLIVVYSGGREVARATDSTFGPGGMGLSVVPLRGQTPALLHLKSFEVYESASAPATNADLPQHGKLVYDLAEHLDDLAQRPQQRQENTIVVKNRSLEFTAGAELATIAQLPIGGISDFVAVMRVAAVARKPLLQLRFHRGASDHVVQIPPYLHLGPAEAGARSVGEHPCCLDFDILAAPSPQGTPTFYTGPQIRTTAAPPGEAQQIVVSVKGTLIVVYSEGREIARVTTPSTGGTGMYLTVFPRARLQGSAVLRLDGLQIYEAAAR